MKQFCIVSMVLMASCLQAGAETLTVEQGGVSINQGQGFRPVRGTVETSVGDLVKVDAKGRAKLSSLCAELQLKPGVTRVNDTCAAARGMRAQVLDGDQGSQINPLYVATALAVAGGIAGGTVAATSGGGGSGPLILPPLAPISR
jgi:hypothetical protein